MAIWLKGGLFMSEYTKIQTAGTNVALKVRKGHFATNHAHTNYHLDLATAKCRASEAQGLAKALVHNYLFATVVDTIVCMEGTSAMGAFLSEELTRSGFLNTNAHKTIYIVRPEFNSNSQIIFRDNLKPMIAGKNVMILMGSVVTGRSLNRAMESISYYGGKLTGVSAIFSAIDELNGMKITSVFGKKDLPDYAYYDYHDCPMCKAGQKIEGLVNAYGLSMI
jgi:orotate phosphoribosyltransferase